MTREEAMYLLNNLRSVAEGKEDEAIDMAIEALRKESVYEQVKWERDMALYTLEEHGIGLGQRCDTNVQNMHTGDLISREAAIDAITNTGSMVAYHDASEMVLFGSAFRQKEIIDIINALPSAEPRLDEESYERGYTAGQFADRPQGEWIYQSKFGRIECKACGHVFRSYVYPRNFCPNCGAKMKGGDSK